MKFVDMPRLNPKIALSFKFHWIPQEIALHECTNECQDQLYTESWRPMDMKYSIAAVKH